MLNRLPNTMRVIRYFEPRMEHFYYTCHPAIVPQMTTG